MNGTTPHTVRRAGFIGLLACLSIALTAWAVGAREPADEVEDARRAAERAAAAETAVTSIDRDSESPTRGDGSLRDFGRGLGRAELSILPDDWEEAGLDPSAAKRRGDRMVQELANGLHVELTIDPDLQRHLEKLLEEYEVPHGGVAIVEPETGRVLALVSHTTHDPEMPGLARRAAGPAASTFKIVTAAALIESAGVNWRAETCYHGGASHLTESNIKGDPDRDNRCKDLGDALAWSINSIFAKLAYKHLEQKDLEVWARRFGYNTEIPFELPVEQSTADIVSDPLERARVAAGFWHTYLSPLHGALIGASLENGGLLMRPSIIEKVKTPEGDVLKSFEPKVLRRVMSEETADTLAKLLGRTTEKGTASDEFEGRAAFPSDVRSGGKTGTLANDNPYLSFTWFVGFGQHRTVADRDAAIGSLLCNTPKWRIKGPYAASEGLRQFFEVREQRAKAADNKEVAEK